MYSRIYAVETRKGLSGKHPDYPAGQFESSFGGSCYHDEIAWASAWACISSEGIEQCFEKVETLLEEAEKNCDEPDNGLKWGFNDVRLGVRLLLAEYSKSSRNLNIFARQLEIIMKSDLRDVCQDPEKATSLANMFTMAAHLKEHWAQIQHQT